MTDPHPMTLLILVGVVFLYGGIAGVVLYIVLKSLSEVKVCDHSKKARPVPNNLIGLLEHALAAQAGNDHELLAAQLHINEAQRALDALADNSQEVLSVLEFIRNAKVNGLNLAAYIDRERAREKEREEAWPK